MNTAANMDTAVYSGEQLDRIREFFSGDRYATETTGITILSAGDGFSEVSLQLDERHMNAAGGVMGAVYLTMADFAFAVAVNAKMAFDGPQSVTKHPLTVTLSSNAYFLSSAHAKDTLTAKASRIKEGRQTCLYEIVIREAASGKELIRVEVQGYRITSAS